MSNEVIPSNLRNEPTMHHFNLDGLIPQTKHSINNSVVSLTRSDEILIGGVLVAGQGQIREDVYKLLSC